MTLANKVVIVTGSTTGIGRAIADRCVAEGARVVVHGRDRARGEAVVERLGKAAALHVDDLADPHAPQRLVDFAVERFGGVDVIVNNAARVVRSTLQSTSIELFDDVIATNVRAPLFLVKAALPYLQASHGCVANIGSVNGLGGESNLLAYSISKGALQTLSKNLADALAVQQVRFFHFNVGWVLTENEYHYKLADGLPEDWPEQLSSLDIPSGKMTTPDQIAQVVCFWISDASRPFSGTVMELEQHPFEGRNPTREEK